MSRRLDATLPQPPPPVAVGGTVVDLRAPSAVPALLQRAWRSAAGQGATTVVDPQVRLGWELPAAELVGLDDAAWAGTLQACLDDAAEHLGLGGPVVAQLDKLVLYPPGGHFVPHRDTLRADGHVATLVVRCQAAEAGGELVVGDTHPTEDPPQAGGLIATVFLPDVSHEVRPVIAGTRVALLYRVVRSGPYVLPPPCSEVPTSSLAEAAVVDGQVAVLSHAYADDALQAGALVGSDRALAGAWLAQLADGDDLVVAAVSVRYEEDLGLQVSCRLHPHRALRGHVPEAWRGASVHLGPLAAALLRRHPQPGSLAFHTGNEGVARSYRYRAAALVRTHPNPTGRVRFPDDDPDVLLNAAQAIAEVRAQALADRARAMLAQAEAVRSGAWLAQRRAALAEELARCEGYGEALDRTGALHVLQPALRELIADEVVPFDGDEPSDEPAWATRLLAWPADGEGDGDGDVWWRRAPSAVADLAEEQGWQRLDQVALEEASDALLAHITEVVADELRGAAARRLARCGQLRVLRVHGLRLGDGARVALPSSLRHLHLGEVAQQHSPVDLGQLPHLVSLDVSGLKLSGTAPVCRARLAHTQPAVPEGVLQPELRSLCLVGDTFWSDRPSLALSGLIRCPQLHTLDIDADLVATLPTVPWPALQALHTLRLRHGSRQVPHAPLPSQVADRVASLQVLELHRLDLHGLTLEHADDLVHLSLTDCRHPPSLPSGQRLRHLAVEGPFVVLPPELPLLESLHLSRVRHLRLDLRTLPRLRRLVLHDVHQLQLLGVDHAHELRHLEVVSSDLTLPDGLSLPQLESLVLRDVPVDELTLHAPALRVLRLQGLPLHHLDALRVPALEEAHLDDLPLPAIPRAWCHAALRTLMLSRLAGLTALPDALAGCAGLEELGCVEGALKAIPDVGGLQHLHTLHLWGQPLPVDEHLVAVVRALPSLTTLWLYNQGMGPEGEGDPRPEAQLADALAPAEPQSPPPPGQVGGLDDDDDIPF